MFIGHLPAGYLLTRAWLSRTNESLHSDRRLLFLGLAASVAPDVDLLWFYLVDARRHVHHGYWTHLPAFWLGVFAVVAVIFVLGRVSPRTWLGLGIVASNVMLHLVFDTIAGGVEWLWPLRNTEYMLVDVPARYSPWYLNFLLHWTFALELFLVGAALWVWWAERARCRRFGTR